MALVKKLAGGKSQIGQDSFVLHILDYKKNGFYLEIGSAHPIEISNTYILENSYAWKGVSVELDPELYNLFISERKQMCLNQDATKIQYAQMLSRFKFPKIIDYLSIDIDPPRQSMQALLKVLKSGYEFSIITFEHDLYLKKRNLYYKYFARLVLKQKGYKLLVSNVANVKGKPQEDWYVRRGTKVLDNFPKNVPFSEFIQ